MTDEIYWGYKNSKKNYNSIRRNNSQNNPKPKSKGSLDSFMGNKKKVIKRSAFY